MSFIFMKLNSLNFNGQYAILLPSDLFLYLFIDPWLFL